MKNRFQSFSFLLTLAVILGLTTLGGTLQAQNAPPPSQQAAPDQSSPAPQQPSQTQPPAQTPEQTAPSPEQPPAAQSGQSSGSQAQTDASGGQTFTGTVVKQGDKYMLQDAASGTTYDIDHQDEVKKFDGKKVRVHGTLDASGKMIHVQ